MLVFLQLDRLECIWKANEHTTEDDIRSPALRHDWEKTSFHVVVPFCRSRVSRDLWLFYDMFLKDP